MLFNFDSGQVLYIHWHAWIIHNKDNFIIHALVWTNMHLHNCSEVMVYCNSLQKSHVYHYNTNDFFSEMADSFLSKMAVKFSNYYVSFFFTWILSSVCVKLISLLCYSSIWLEQKLEEIILNKYYYLQRPAVQEIHELVWLVCLFWKHSRYMI